VSPLLFENIPFYQQLFFLYSENQSAAEEVEFFEFLKTQKDVSSTPTIVGTAILTNPNSSDQPLHATINPNMLGIQPYYALRTPPATPAFFSPPHHSLNSPSSSGTLVGRNYPQEAQLTAVQGDFDYNSRSTSQEPDFSQLRELVASCLLHKMPEDTKTTVTLPASEMPDKDMEKAETSITEELVEDEDMEETRLTFLAEENNVMEVVEGYEGIDDHMADVDAEDGVWRDEDQDDVGGLPSMGGGIQQGGDMADEVLQNAFCSADDEQDSIDTVRTTVTPRKRSRQGVGSRRKRKEAPTSSTSDMKRSNDTQHSQAASSSSDTIMESSNHTQHSQAGSDRTTQVHNAYGDLTEEEQKSIGRLSHEELVNGLKFLSKEKNWSFFV
jgi:hypothetical protein